MAIIKCKMCGGDIELSENRTVGTCAYCGSTMTLPKIDDEQRAAAFNRGNHFRRIGEFDKALAVYERIVSEDDADAEAHWCCALCRFGIEYVEDPTSHEWLPTCHRASFDSILEDVDYKAAVAHSEGRTARRYRVEAEKIAEVQRGILRLSQSEQPFDVFICYKETDERGERTKDSVLAQEIYYQLTDKGLRVFFARITLEDKAGTQYEPYIFAALNSAKVMVVVGTKAEYVSAVWVRNEWSRFLSLMKHDRTKLLLPCYRDMDPYDLPEQLSVLQAYDMGKIGFMQDLIRGIEKVLSREKPQAPRETVVVRGGGGGNEGALIMRGNMELEDGDWQAADGFFDRVLDEDAKNAEAYLGKFLAGKHAPTLEAYLNAQLSQAAQAQTNRLCAVEPDEARIQAAVERYAVPGYLYEEDIRTLYAFDGGYDSAVQALREERNRRLTALDGDRLFPRAVRFAQGDFKAALDGSLQRFHAGLDRLVSDAEAQDAQNVRHISEAYAQHVGQVERELSQRYEQALAKKQADEEREHEHRYQEACRLRQNAKNAAEVEAVAKPFELLKGYKDSAQLAEACKKRAAQMRREVKRKKKNARIWMTVLIIAAVAAIVAALLIMKGTLQFNYDERTLPKIAMGIAAVTTITAFLFILNVAIPSSRYNKAEELLAQGNYDGAAAAFKAAKSYQDAAERVLATHYAKARTMLARGDYDGAVTAFKAAKSYQNAAEHIPQTHYVHAEALLAEGRTAAAAIAFGKAGGYQDARTRSMALWSEAAERKTLVVKNDYIAGLKSDGTVVAAGKRVDARCYLSGWRDIVAIAVGYNHTVGLRSDGTVIAAGEERQSQCNVSDWRDIVAVASGGNYTVGLRLDGTVVATGWLRSVKCDAWGWTDIVAVAASGGHTVGLKSDGTVVAVGQNDNGQCNVSGWRDIVAVAVSDLHTVGLKSDGTVVAVGRNDDDQCDVSGWRNIVAVVVSDDHTVGLRSDGTVVAVGNNKFGQCYVNGWRDITAVAAHGQVGFTIGLKSDGTVVAVGDNRFGQCDVSGWTDIVAVATSSGYTVGLKSDGTVVAAGDNGYDECNVDGWTDIKLP